MTLSGMTPAEQVAALGLAVGDTIEVRQEYRRGAWCDFRRQLLAVGRDSCIWDCWVKDFSRPDWFHQGENSDIFTLAGWTKTASDPSIDPLTPLREQLTQGWAIMDQLYNLTSHILTKSEHYPVRAWLGRNAAFGPGKGEGQ